MQRRRSASRAPSARSGRIEPLERRRMLAAGDPDLAFSGDGRATLNFPGAALAIVDTAVTTEGKVVVAGTKGGNMAVARLNADGTVDTTFGNGGLYESTRRDELTSVAVQGDGKIIVGLGQTSGFEHVDLIVGRLLANGAGFDPTFGDNGIAHAGRERFGSSTINDVAVQRDGKIIGAGAVDNGLLLDYDLAVVRYDVNGALDSTFDGDGLSVHSVVGDVERITGVTIDYNGDSGSNPLYGSIVAVGANGGTQAGGTQANRFLLLRLRPDGTPHTGFGSGGTLFSPDLSGAGVEYARDVVVQPGGKVVVAGTAASASDPQVRNFLVARYTSAGTLDTTFGVAGGGVTELDLGGRDEVGAIAIGYHNTLGNLVVAGSRNSQMALVALTPDGQLDTRFSGDGILTTTIPGTANGLFATGSLFPPVRKLVFAGGNGHVARYVDVGSLISVGTFQPNMYEQGQVATSFLVTRTKALPIAETIVLTTTGTATTLGANRDFNGSGILFGNGQTTSTEVVIPAGATSVTATLTPIDDALVEGDETIGFTVGTTLTYDASLTNSTTLVVRDNDLVGGPAVIADGFHYEVFAQNVTITFNQNVQATFTIGDLVVTGPGAAPPAYLLNYFNVTNTGTVVFYEGLTDGDYTVTVRGSGVTVGGIPMSGDHTVAFFFMSGDANRDRSVNISDFSILATHFNTPGTFGKGDFNYNGLVDIADFSILASKFNTSLPASTPADGRPSPPAGGASAGGAADAAAPPFALRRVAEVLDEAAAATAVTG